MLLIEDNELPVPHQDPVQSCDSGLGQAETLYDQLAWNIQNDENWLR